MHPAAWSEELLIGIPEMDKEHCLLFEAMRELLTVGPQASREHVFALLDRIERHAGKHFAHEERLMRRAGYGGTEWHRQQHRAARKRILPLLRAARHGGEPERTALVDFL